MSDLWLQLLKVPEEAISLELTIGLIPNQIVRQICLDVKRTVTDNPESLKTLLELHATYFPCDGYIQGMNLCAVPFVETLNINEAFWAFAMFMGTIRNKLPTNMSKFFHFAKKWEQMFHKFTGYKCDGEHTMALKAGVFKLSPMMNKNNLKTVWNAMLQHDHNIFTAAFAAAAVRRHYRNKKYDCMTAHMIQILNVEPLIRRAIRTIIIYKR